MTNEEFLTIFQAIDDELITAFARYFHQEGQQVYNNLMTENDYDPMEAMYEVIMRTTKAAMKYSVMLTLYLTWNVEPEKPLTKNELRQMLKVIKPDSDPRA